MKEHEQKTIEKAEKLTAELERIPALRAYREKEAAEILAKRTAAADRIKDLNLDFEACGVLRREIDGAVLKLAELDTEREKMKTVINEKAYFLAKEKSGIEGEIRQQTEILFSSYGAEIDAGIEFFRVKHDELMRPGKISKNALGSERNIFTETKKIKEETNAGAVVAALQYCRDAIRKLDEMKLCPAVDLPGIEALKAGIPKIDVYSEFEAEKPLPQGPSGGLLAKIQHETHERIEELLSGIRKMARA